MSTYSEQILLRSNQFDTKVIFSCSFFIRTISSLEKLLLEQLLLFNSYFFRIATFFREKLLNCSYFLRKANRQFFRVATFSQDKVDQNKYIYIRTTFLKQILKSIHFSYFFQKATPKKVIFYNSYFLKTANFSKKEYFRVLTFTVDPPFQSSYFFKKLLFDSRCFLTVHSFRPDVFITSSPQLHFLFVSW